MISKPTMSRYRVVLFFGILILLTFPSASIKAFHKDIYYPRAPEALLEILQDIDNPFSPTRKNIEEGSKVYFGKGLCVKCHGVNGKGLEVSGHPPRNFTDLKWQDVRTDGEMMWVLKMGVQVPACRLELGGGSARKKLGR